MYAFGDCCLTVLNEEKNIPSMRNFSPALIQNIKDLSTGKKPTTEIPKQIPLVAFVSLGPNYCVKSMGDDVEGNEGLGAMKVGVLDGSANSFKAPAPQ